MRTARLFTNGRSQAVRLPKDCRFPGRDVYVKKFEGMVMLLPKEDLWATLIDSLERFSDDFMAERNEPTQDARAEL
jgi:antitoxin VapB